MGQVAQTVDPETWLKLPLLQVVHVDDPVCDVKVPGGHATQVELVMEPRRSE